MKTSKNTTFINLLDSGEQILIDIPNQPLAVICKADKLTSNQLNLMLGIWQSIPYLLLSTEQINRLEIPIIGKNSLGWLMTETIEASTGIKTGISTIDRSLTISKAVNPTSTPQDIMMPGHILCAVSDDKESEPALLLYNHLQPYNKPLIWMPALTDSLKSLDKSMANSVAKSYNIPFTKI